MTTMKRRKKEPRTHVFIAYSEKKTSNLVEYFRLKSELLKSRLNTSWAK